MSTGTCGLELERQHLVELLGGRRRQRDAVGEGAVARPPRRPMPSAVLEQRPGTQP